MRKFLRWLGSLFTTPSAATNRRDRLSAQGERDALSQQFRGGL